MALGRWFTPLQTYLDAGGETLDDDRKKTSTSKLLPWKIQEKDLRDFDGFKSCEHFVSWIKAAVRTTPGWKPGGTEAHSVAELGEHGQRAVS